MAPRSSRVFDIIELAAMIFRLVDRPDCARMCRVNRVMFHAASRIVWEHVDGVHNLLRLFPKSHVTELDFSNGVSPRFQFTLYEPEGQILHAGRFDVYAPFVRSLDIYGKAATRLDIRGWSDLMRLSKRQTMLPNLVSLTMTTSCDRGWDLLLWIRLFASRSLVSVLATSTKDPVAISYPAATAVLKWLVEHCPHLQTVCLFPSNEASRSEIFDAKGDTLAGLLYDQPFHHYLLPTLGIRQLSCSLSVLENDSLQALSKLPNLERLTVYAVDEHVDSEHPLLPGDSFPSLKCLSLWSDYCWDLTWALSIQSLLARIVTLEVYCDIRSNDEAVDWMIDHFLPALANGTALEDLAIHFDSDPPAHPSHGLLDLNNTSNDGSVGLITALGAFCGLPLRRVSIPCITFWVEPSVVNLGSIWPQVTHLELEGVLATCQALLAFAQLPQLKYLKLRLAIRVDIRQVDIFGQRRPVGLNLHTLEGSVRSRVFFGPQDVDEVARFLLSLWPNLQQVIWPGNGSSQFSKPVVELLNQSLVSLTRLHR